jgi:tricorn protease
MVTGKLKITASRQTSKLSQDPKLVREGHDPQLERAVKVALEMLEKDPPKTYKRPPYPDYHPKLSTGEAGR